MSAQPIPAAELRHRMPGRARLRVPSMRGRQDYFERVRDELSRSDGVEEVKVNPGTASVVVRHRPDVDTDSLERFSRERGLFRLVAPEAPPEILTGGLSALLDWNSAEVRKGFLALFLGGGAYQILRGNVWPAGITLFWYALTMMPPPVSPEASARLNGPGSREL